MTAPSYTTDLATFNLCENSGTFSEFTGMISAGSPALDDTDDPIQGSYMTSQTGKIAAAALGSIACDYGSGVSIPTDGAILIWQKWDAGGILETYANGGLRIVVGADISNWDAWKCGGSNKAPNPYGGWYNYAVNPTARTYDYRNGSGPGTTYRWAGMAFTLTALGPAKGNPHKLDAIRYGRASSIFEYGETADYCTIAGFAAVNDDNTGTYGYNKWGLIQEIAGGYLYKGLMQLGTSSNAVDFRDSNRFILIDDTPNCTTNFNTIEVNNASSRVDMSNFIFKALGTTSPGRWVTNANADLNLDACQFFDMSTFLFGGTGSEFLNCLFQGCGLITVAGGKLNGSQILTPSVTSGGAIDWDVNVNPDGYLDGLTVTKGSGTHHAINFGDTVPSTMTIRNCTFTGFNASDNQNDSTFYFEDTAGSITLNCVSCSGNLTWKSAGVTVTIVADPVTVKVTSQEADGTPVGSVTVMLKARNATGPFPYQESVTIVNSGTTATVTHNSHGMATNDYVLIEGASLDANNGVFQITLDGVDPSNKYSYTMGSSPGSSPTGTITSTFVALFGTTNATTGILSTSRVYSADQPVTGYAAKATTPPYWKRFTLTDTVDDTDGLNMIAVMLPDS